MDVFRLAATDQQDRFKMRTVRTKVYSFDELTEDAKLTVIGNLSDINVNYEWWESTYEDAKNIGLKITSFDIGRASICEGSLIWDVAEVTNAIIKEHGETCATFETAKQYLTDYNNLVVKYSDGIKTDIVAEGNEYDFDQEADDLDANFLQSILEDYRMILSKEYDYLTSSEAIKESIEANSYEFLENGNIF